MDHHLAFILTYVNKRALLFFYRNPQSELHLRIPSKVHYFRVFDAFSFELNIDASVLIKKVILSLDQFVFKL